MDKHYSIIICQSNKNIWRLELLKVSFMVQLMIWLYSLQACTWHRRFTKMKFLIEVWMHILLVSFYTRYQIFASSIIMLICYDVSYIRLISFQISFFFVRFLFLLLWVSFLLPSEREFKLHWTVMPRLML